MNLLALEGMGHGLTVLFTVVLGVLVIFLGMTIIITFLILMGRIFDFISNKQKKELKPQKEETSIVTEIGIDEKTRSAIIASIYMYYLQEDNNCEFIVRDIKKV